MKAILAVPSRTRVDFAGGSQGLLEGRRRRRCRRPHGRTRQARRCGRLRHRPSPGQQAEPQQLERPGAGASEVAPKRIAAAMKIRAHSESHIVELDDGSRWQIFPGDLDLTLNWKPETEISVALAEDNLGSHVLVGAGANVRAIPEGESWPVREVKNALKDG